jgi:small subunit ribosomal protein S6
LRSYELALIFDPSLEEEAIDKELSKITSLVEKEKGSISNVDRWGVRKLAYPIKKMENGFYIIVYFEGNSKIIQELDRLNKINDKILRHMVVKSNQSASL